MNFFILVIAEAYKELFSIDLKSPRCFTKKDVRKTKKAEPDLKLSTPKPYIRWGGLFQPPLDGTISKI